MYELIQFIDISDGYPGMLIPIFSSNSTNLPYVQQMDEYFQIKEMLPFLDYENYRLVMAERGRAVGVADRGLVAFRSADHSIVCGNPAEIIEYIEAHRELIRRSAHLDSQLRRIEGEKLSSMHEPWSRVAKESFERGDQQAFWLNSEVALFQSQAKIWEDIDSEQHQEKSGKRIGFKGQLSNYSSEYLIRWLSDRSNFIFSDWVKIWHHVNEQNPFEQRLVDVAQRWLFFSQASGGDLGEARSILFTLLHHARFSKGTLSELGSFLADELSDSPFSIFYFLRPSELFANLFWFLGNYGDPQSVVALAQFCASELPREAHIVNAVIDSLNALSGRANEEEVVRDARKLILELQPIESA
jgi:hypothetical protein